MKLINRNDVLHLLLRCSWSFSSSFLRHLVEDFTKRRRRRSPSLPAQPVMPRNTNNTRGKTQWCRPSGNQDKEKTLNRVMRCLSTSNNSSKFRADLCSLVDCGCKNYGRRCDACVPGSAWKTMVACYLDQKYGNSLVLESTLFHYKIMMMIIITIIIIITNSPKLTIFLKMPFLSRLMSRHCVLTSHIMKELMLFVFFLQKRTNKHISTETIRDLFRIIPFMNNFAFNSKHYLQKHGTVMDTPLAPSYANLFLGKFERDALHSYLWLRFMDDIFLTWTAGSEKQKIFVDYLNNLHSTIKFTWSHSLTNIYHSLMSWFQSRTAPWKQIFILNLLTSIYIY